MGAFVLVRMPFMPLVLSLGEWEQPETRITDLQASWPKRIPLGPSYVLRPLVVHLHTLPTLHLVLSFHCECNYRVPSPESFLGLSTDPGVGAFYKLPRWF